MVWVIWMVNVFVVGGFVVKGIVVFVLFKELVVVFEVSGV